MKFGTGSNNELTQKYEKVKLQNDILTSKHIYKQTSPIFNCVTPVSDLLRSLTNNFFSSETSFLMHIIFAYIYVCIL